MAPTLVPSPILEVLLRRQAAAVPGLALAPVTPLVPDRATKPELVVAALAAAAALALATLPALDRGTLPAVAAEAEPAAVAEAAPVVVINPARVLVALTVLVPAISPAAVVGTKSLFGDE